MEPLYNYHRLPVSPLLGGALACTSLGAHARVLTLGTAGGEVLLCDTAGRERARVRAHKERVNAVLCDESGAWVASCGEDGSELVAALPGGGASGEPDRPAQHGRRELRAAAGAARGVPRLRLGGRCRRPATATATAAAATAAPQRRRARVVAEGGNVPL